MNQLNSLIIEGNVVRQAELSEPTAGFKVCKFPVAVDRWYKNRNGEGVSEVSYFDVETYGKMAEVCEKQGLKGRGVRVVGRLKQDRWKDSEGKSQSRIYVIAEHVEYKPKPQSNTANTSSSAPATPSQSLTNDVQMNHVQPAETVAVPATESLVF